MEHRRRKTEEILQCRGGEIRSGEFTEELRRQQAGVARFDAGPADAAPSVDVLFSGLTTTDPPLTRHRPATCHR